MFQFIAGAHVAYFAAGAVTAFVGEKALKSKGARKLAVAGLAKGILVKEAVSETLCNIREDAADLCAEAREAAIDVDDLLSFDQNDGE